MAINQEIPINVYNGDGVTVEFTGEFTVATGIDLAVYVDAMKKSESTDYIITGLGTNPFSVIFSTPPASGSTVLLKRIIDYNRLNDYQEGGDLLADTLDGDLDRIVSQMQQLAAIIDPDYSNFTGRALAAPLDGIGGVFKKTDFDNRQSTIVGYNHSKELTLYPQTQVTVAIQTYYKTSDYASVEAMVATLVGGPYDVIIDSNIGCTTDCSIPATIRLIGSTGTISVASGKTLTINGAFDAGLYQVFSGGGSVKFSGGVADNVPVEWFGAVAGTTDSAAMTLNVAAIKAAIESRNNGTSYTGNVVFANGIYYVNDEIISGTASKYVSAVFKGHGIGTNIQQQNAAKAIFNFDYGYSFAVDKIRFTGGTKAITFNTHNVDQARPTITSCEFLNQTEHGIYAQSGSTSTQLSISKCLFSGDNTAVEAYVNFMQVRDCWATPSGDKPVFVVGNGGIYLSGLVGASTSAAVINGAWVKTINASATITDNRLAADVGTGRPAIEHVSNVIGLSTKLVIERNFFASTDYVFKINELPQFITISNNYGYGSKGSDKGMWIASTANVQTIKTGSYKIDDDLLIYYNDGTGYTLANGIMSVKGQGSNPDFISRDVLQSETVTAELCNVWFANQIFSNCSAATVAYPQLGGANGYKVTCSADNASFTTSSDAYVSQVPVDSGFYTYVIDVYVTGAVNPINSRFIFREDTESVKLYNGMNVVSVFGNPKTGDYNMWQLDFSNMNNGTALHFGRVRVFKGMKKVNTVNTVYRDLSSASLPGGTYDLHSLGDRIEYTNPTAAGFLGKVVTTAGGTTATWKTYGAISA